MVRECDSMLRPAKVPPHFSGFPRLLAPYLPMKEPVGSLLLQSNIAGSKRKEYDNGIGPDMQVRGVRFAEIVCKSLGHDR
jgi:hypothetical protein